MATPYDPDNHPLNAKNQLGFSLRKAVKRGTSLTPAGRIARKAPVARIVHKERPRKMNKPLHVAPITSPLLAPGVPSASGPKPVSAPVSTAIQSPMPPTPAASTMAPPAVSPASGGGQWSSEGEPYRDEIIQESAIENTIPSEPGFDDSHVAPESDFVPGAGTAIYENVTESYDSEISGVVKPMKAKTKPKAKSQQKTPAEISTIIAKRLAPIKQKNPEFYKEIVAAMQRVNPSYASQLGGMDGVADTFSSVLSDAIKTYGDIQINKAKSAAQQKAAIDQINAAQAQAKAAHSGIASDLSDNKLVWILGALGLGGLAWYMTKR